MTLDQYSSLASYWSESSKNEPPMPGRLGATSPTWLVLTQLRPTLVLSASIGLTAALPERCQKEKRIQSPCGTSQVTVPSGAVLDVRSTSEPGSRIVDSLGGVSTDVTAGPRLITRAAVTAMSLPVGWLSPMAFGAFSEMWLPPVRSLRPYISSSVALSPVLSGVFHGQFVPRVMSSVMSFWRAAARMVLRLSRSVCVP